MKIPESKRCQTQQTTCAIGFFTSAVC